MIGHQNISVNGYAKPQGGIGEREEEQLIVSCRSKDVDTVVSALHYVLSGSVNEDSRASCHACAQAYLVLFAEHDDSLIFRRFQLQMWTD